MPSDERVDTVREAVGVFLTPEAQQDAIDELMSSGFDRAELSLLAAEKTVEEKLGHKYRQVAELEDDAKVPRTCYVSTESIGDAEGALIGGLAHVAAGVALGPIVASGGALAVAIAGTALAGGAGGLIGAVFARLLGDHHANYLNEQLDRGGLLLWVRTWDTDDERRAAEILAKHSGRDVHVHTLPASA
jgi:hypothetical protein